MDTHMKLIIPLMFTTLIVLGCSSDPIIVPDTTSDNVVMMELKDRIAEPGTYSSSYGWLFWYAPLATLLILWGYRHLIKKPIDCIEQEPDSVKVQSKLDGDPKT